MEEAILTPDGEYTPVDWKERNELTRQGKNLCRVCGRPQSMYMKPWCEVCDKPWPEPEPVLNLVKALYHLEAIGHVGIKDRVWEWLVCDENDWKHNDQGFYFSFPTPESLAEFDDEWTDEQLADCKLLRETFELPETILMYLSW